MHNNHNGNEINMLWHKNLKQTKNAALRTYFDHLPWHFYSIVLLNSTLSHQES